MYILQGKWKFSFWVFSFTKKAKKAWRYPVCFFCFFFHIETQSRGTGWDNHDGHICQRCYIQTEILSLWKKKKKRRKNKYALWESRRMGFPVYLLSLSLSISCTAAVLFAWHPLADNAQVKLQLCRSRNSQGEQARRRERERERTTRKPSQKERWKLTVRLFFFFHRYIYIPFCLFLLHILTLLFCFCYFAFLSLYLFSISELLPAVLSVLSTALDPPRPPPE